MRNLGFEMIMSLLSMRMLEPSGSHSKELSRLDVGHDLGPENCKLRIEMDPMEDTFLDY